MVGHEGATTAGDDRPANAMEQAGAPEADGAVTPPGAQIAALERDLRTARAEVEALTRRARVEQALHAAGAIDATAARVHVEGALGAAPADEARVAEAVARLKARRPGLFRASEPVRPRVGGASAMGGVAAVAPPADTPGALADRARAGDRGSLLAYLRARRAR